METTPKRNIGLIELTSLDIETQMQVREIRNEEGVRRWMYTDHEIGVNEHLGWIARLKADDRQIVFAVIDQDEAKPLGVVSLNAIDRLHNKADWAFYLTKDARGGLGSALEFHFLNFVFDRCGFEKLNCEVIEGNDAVVSLHEKFHFEEEGFRRSNISKGGVRIGVHFLGITKADWERARLEVHDRYREKLDRFSFSIDYQAISGGEKTEPIDAIQEARARNNINWMSILRLALEKSPDTAGPIVNDIKKIDREISTLTDELTKDFDR